MQMRRKGHNLTKGTVHSDGNTIEWHNGEKWLRVPNPQKEVKKKIVFWTGDISDKKDERKEDDKDDMSGSKKYYLRPKPFPFKPISQMNGASGG